MNKQFELTRSKIALACFLFVLAASTLVMAFVMFRDGR